MTARQLSTVCMIRQQFICIAWGTYPIRATQQYLTTKVKDYWLTRTGMGASARNCGFLGDLSEFSLAARSWLCTLCSPYMFISSLATRDTYPVLFSIRHQAGTFEPASPGLVALLLVRLPQLAQLPPVSLWTRRIRERCASSGVPCARGAR